MACAAVLAALAVAVPVASSKGSGASANRGGISAECGLDHVIRWWDEHTVNGLPVLDTYFGHSKFRGYQYGEFGTLTAPHAPAHGYALATTEGLGIGEKLALGRRLYGEKFALSTAQGGIWSVRTTRGRIEGYAWGRPSYGDVSWQGVVATIDAGDVGCPTLGDPGRI